LTADEQTQHNDAVLCPSPSDEVIDSRLSHVDYSNKFGSLASNSASVYRGSEKVLAFWDGDEVDP